MKILFVVEYFLPHVGGAEILFDNLTQGLVEQGQQCVILTTKFDKRLPSYEKLKNGIEVYRVGSNRYNFMWHAVQQGLKLVKSLDLIHTTTFNGAIPAWIIAKISKKKVVITVHEIFGALWVRFMGWKGWFFKLYEMLIFLFRFDAYLCVSNYTKNSLRVYFGLPDSKLFTVYNGIDYKQRTIESQHTNDIENIRQNIYGKNNYIGLFFGRPGISKGLPYFLKAIPDIVKKIPNFKAVLIVGESKNNPAIIEREIIKKLGLDQYLIFLSAVPYSLLKNYILASDVVVVPSLAEGFGFAAAEVSVLSHQLVVTNVGSLSEVVSGKVNFVEPSNSNDIAEKIIKFYDGKYQEIPKKTFLWEDCVEKTLFVYEHLFKL